MNFICIYLLSGILGKLCQNLAFKDISVHLLHHIYQTESLKIIDILKCTQLWFSEDKEFKDIIINEQSRHIAKVFDSEFVSFGVRTLPLQGIPAMVDQETWSASASDYETDKFPVRNLLSQVGVVPIEINKPRSFNLIMKAVSKNKVALGIALEETPSFNKLCVSLICLKSSEKLLGIKWISSSGLKSSIGLVTKNIDDMLVSFKAFKDVPDYSSYETSRSYLKEKNYQRGSYCWYVAIIPFNSTDFYQPFFGPLVTTLNQMGAYIQPVLLYGPAVGDGIFDSKYAITEKHLKMELSKSMYTETKQSESGTKDRERLKNKYPDLKSKIPINVLEKRFMNQTPKASTRVGMWLQDSSRQVLNQFINTKKFDFFATSNDHIELLKIVEWTGLPSITIPSYHQAQNTSITIVSLHYDELGLIEMALELLSYPFYKPYS